MNDVIYQIYRLMFNREINVKSLKGTEIQFDNLISNFMDILGIEKMISIAGTEKLVFNRNKNKIQNDLKCVFESEIDRINEQFHRLNEDV